MVSRSAHDNLLETNVYLQGRAPGWSSCAPSQWSMEKVELVAQCSGCGATASLAWTEPDRDPDVAQLQRAHTAGAEGRLVGRDSSAGTDG